MIRGERLPSATAKRKPRASGDDPIAGVLAYLLAA